jgi:hypothetical protein
MGGTEADLREFFNEAFTAFNNDGDLSRFLDPNATVYSIRLHEPYSKSGVTTYLNQQYQANTRYTSPANLTVTLNADGTGAIIQGTTTRTDKDYPSGQQLIFCCTFVYNNGWLLSVLWAA